MCECERVQVFFSSSYSCSSIHSFVVHFLRYLLLPQVLAAAVSDTTTTITPFISVFQTLLKVLRASAEHPLPNKACSMGPKENGPGIFQLFFIIW